MLEALIVAILTFVGLVVWAAFINLVVKTVFDFFDRRVSTPASLPGPETVAQLRMAAAPQRQRAI